MFFSPSRVDYPRAANKEETGKWNGKSHCRTSPKPKTQTPKTHVQTNSGSHKVLQQQQQRPPPWNAWCSRTAGQTKDTKGIRQTCRRGENKPEHMAASPQNGPVNANPSAPSTHRRVPFSPALPSHAWTRPPAFPPSRVAAHAWACCVGWNVTSGNVKPPTTPRPRATCTYLLT